MAAAKVVGRRAICSTVYPSAKVISRVSPEATVPVRHRARTSRHGLGGARQFVAANVAALGAECPASSTVVGQGISARQSVRAELRISSSDPSIHLPSGATHDVQEARPSRAGSRAGIDEEIDRQVPPRSRSSWAALERAIWRIADAS